MITENVTFCGCFIMGLCFRRCTCCGDRTTGKRLAMEKSLISRSERFFAHYRFNISSVAREGGSMGARKSEGKKRGLGRGRGSFLSSLPSLPFFSHFFLLPLPFPGILLQLPAISPQTRSQSLRKTVGLRPKISRQQLVFIDTMKNKLFYLFLLEYKLTAYIYFFYST